MRTLREFLLDPKTIQNLYQTNSLALALQYARKGIRTTLIDMKGAYERQPDTADNDNVTEHGFGGLPGIVACDILRMDRDGLCDVSGRLHVSDYDPRTSKNMARDRWPRELTDQQLEEMDELMREYDCGVWEHLARYQSEGLVRILYPSKGLFESCGGTGGGGGGFDTLLKNIQAIAGRPFSETGYVPSPEERRKHNSLIKKRKQKDEKKKLRATARDRGRKLRNRRK